MHETSQNNTNNTQQNLLINSIFFLVENVQTKNLRKKKQKTKQKAKQNKKA